MKKIFTSYIITWILLFALFNVLVFVVPAGNFGLEKFTSTFWIGYTTITLAFLGQFACAYFALKTDSLQKTFYRLSLLQTSYTGLILTLVVGSKCLLFPWFPYYFGIILCFGILVINALAVIRTVVAIEAVESIDKKIKVQTQFIKLLTADAEHLVSTSKSAELKAEAKKVYEAIRYSDPMSNAALADIEGQIQGEFTFFSQAIKSEDLELAKSVSEGLINLIDGRNKKCKALK